MQQFKGLAGVESFGIEGPGGEESGNYDWDDVCAMKVNGEVFICHGKPGEPLVVEKVLTTQEMPTEQVEVLFDGETEEEEETPAIGEEDEEDEDDEEEEEEEVGPQLV